MSTTNILKIYLNLDGTLTHKLNTFMSRGSHLTNNIVLVTPIHTDHIVYVNFKNEPGDEIPSLLMEVMGYEEVTLDSGDREIWNTYQVSVPTTVLSLLAKNRVSTANIGFSFYEYQKPNPSYTFQGVATTLESANTIYPPSEVNPDTTFYIGIGVVPETGDISDLEVAEKVENNEGLEEYTILPGITLGEYEDSKGIDNSLLKQDSEVIKVPISPNIPYRGSSDLNYGDYLQSTLADTRERLDDVEDILGEDGYNVVKTDLKSNYMRVTSLETEDSLYIQKRQGAHRRVTMEDLKEALSGDLGVNKGIYENAEAFLTGTKPWNAIHDEDPRYYGSYGGVETPSTFSIDIKDENYIDLGEYATEEEMYADQPPLDRLTYLADRQYVTVGGIVYRREPVPQYYWEYSPRDIYKGSWGSVLDLYDAIPMISLDEQDFAFATIRNEVGDPTRENIFFYDESLEGGEIYAGEAATKWYPSGSYALAYPSLKDLYAAYPASPNSAYPITDTDAMPLTDGTLMTWGPGTKYVFMSTGITEEAFLTSITTTTYTLTTTIPNEKVVWDTNALTYVNLVPPEEYRPGTGEIVSQVTINKEDIAAILDGSKTVGGATNDGAGNEITTTYETKVDAQAKIDDLAGEGRVDETVKGNATDIATNTDDITAIDARVTTNTDDIAALDTRVTTNASDIASLTDTKQDKSDSSLSTSDKTVVGAINELKVETDAKIEDIEVSAAGELVNNTKKINFVGSGVAVYVDPLDPETSIVYVSDRTSKVYNTWENFNTYPIGQTFVKLGLLNPINSKDSGLFIQDGNLKVNDVDRTYQINYSIKILENDIQANSIEVKLVNILDSSDVVLANTLDISGSEPVLGEGILVEGTLDLTEASIDKTYQMVAIVDNGDVVLREFTGKIFEKIDTAGGIPEGDMTKEMYDTNDNGRVDNADFNPTGTTFLQGVDNTQDALTVIDNTLANQSDSSQIIDGFLFGDNVQYSGLFNDTGGATIGTTNVVMISETQTSSNTDVIYGYDGTMSFGIQKAGAAKGKMTISYQGYDAAKKLTVKLPFMYSSPTEYLNIFEFDIEGTPQTNTLEQEFHVPLSPEIGPEEVQVHVTTDAGTLTGLSIDLTFDYAVSAGLDRSNVVVKDFTGNQVISGGLDVNNLYTPNIESMFVQMKLDSTAGIDFTHFGSKLLTLSGSSDSVSVNNYPIKNLADAVDDTDALSLGQAKGLIGAQVKEDVTKAEFKLTLFRHANVMFCEIIGVSSVFNGEEIAVNVPGKWVPGNGKGINMLGVNADGTIPTTYGVILSFQGYDTVGDFTSFKVKFLDNTAATFESWYATGNTYI